MIVANFSLPGTGQLQRSSPVGLESCKSQVPGDLRVAARDVKTQNRVNYNTRVLEFLPILCVPFCFLVVCGGCRRPGPELSRLRGLTQATRCQLSSPRGLESCNSQVPGDESCDSQESPGTCELPPGRHCQAPGDLIVAENHKKTHGKVPNRQKLNDPWILMVPVWVLTTRAATLKSPGT